MDKIEKAPRVVVATLRMGYVRIEAGRAGRRICSEPAYNCGKRTKTTDARAKGPHAEGGQAVVMTLGRRGLLNFLSREARTITSKPQGHDLLIYE